MTENALKSGVATHLERLAALCERRAPITGRVLEALRAEASAVVAAGIVPTDAREGLGRLLAVDEPTRGLLALFAGPLGAALLPEVAALDMDQGGRRLHKDNLRHSLIVTGQAPPRLRLRWSCLLHDVGKAPTRRIAPDGTVSFYNHEAIGERLAVRLLRRLGYEESFALEVGRLVAISGRTHNFDGEWTDSAMRRFATDAGELLEDALDLSRADCTSRRPGRRAEVLAQVDAVAERLASVRATDEAAKVRPAIDGEEIMAVLGLAPGPEVGAAYRYLLGFARDGVDLSPEEARQRLRAWWEERRATGAAGSVTRST